MHLPWRQVRLGARLMDWQELLHTALRATLVYLFVLFVLRVLGKRSVGNLSAFDLFVRLMTMRSFGSVLSTSFPSFIGSECGGSVAGGRNRRGRGHVRARSGVTFEKSAVQATPRSRERGRE